MSVRKRFFPMVEFLTAEEFEMMKASGKILQQVFRTLDKAIVPGMTTYEVDKIAHDIIVGNGAIPSFLNYGEPPFPGSICASVNEEVVHGIPSKKRVLKDGDIISVDVGAILNGYHSDACRTYLVGDVRPEVKDLVERTKQSFFEGLKYAQAGMRTGDIGHAVQEYCEGFGYGVVRELTGHGIGTSLHQDPEVLNYGKAGHGYKLKPGMAICIEPMITLGRKEIEMLNDGWTIITRDGKPAAHYENTILITEDGPVMTTYEEDV